MDVRRVAGRGLEEEYPDGGAEVERKMNAFSFLPLAELHQLN
jgi:hypothetical protein